MVLIYITKPEYIYNYNKKKFKKFGFTDNKTLFSINFIGFVLPVIIYLSLYFLNNTFVYRSYYLDHHQKIVI